MKPAEFEEKEYEIPLYHELAADPNIWSPGQVFEHQIGIDGAVYLAELWLFSQHNFRSVPPGVSLSRYNWPGNWFPNRKKDRLPSYRLNLFMQVKRPEWSSRAGRVMKGFGKKGANWRFAIDQGQQQSLEVLANRLKERALVVYAAPVFHTHRDLFRHIRTSGLAGHSSFPSVYRLSGHQAWYYKCPGASGWANVAPEEIEEPSLKSRIDALTKNIKKSEPEAWAENLKTLSTDIIEALANEALPETSRRAMFFASVNEIDSVKMDFNYAAVWRAFNKVQAFCEAFNLDWCVIQDGIREGI